MKFVWLIPLAVMASACSQSSAKTAETGPATDPRQAELSAKLQAMSPEERAKYAQEHPDEMKSAFSQVPGGGK